jgi:hypothetical protein
MTGWARYLPAVQGTPRRGRQSKARTRSVSALLAVSALALAAIAASCGSSHRSLTTSPTPPTTTAEAEKGDINLTGKIILLACGGSADWQLSAVDPEPRSTPQPIATFLGTGADALNYETALGELSGGSACEVTPSPLLRQLFNGDFTQMAVRERYERDDGSTHTGFLESNGAFVDLTPPTAPSSGYTTPKPADDSGGIFKPGTSTLYFGSNEGLVKVDTANDDHARTTTSLRLAASEVKTGFAAPPYIFSTNGNRATDSIAPGSGESNWYPDDGTIGVGGPYFFDQSGSVAFEAVGDGQVYSDERTLVAVRRADALFTGDADAMTALLSGCTPNSWLNATHILCAGSSQVYVDAVSPGAKVATEKPLLPPADRENSDPVPDAAGSSIAFISQHNDVYSLFVVAATGGTPQKVCDLPDQAHIIAWQ